ncbi:T9SS type B sorting domain-containing protein [Flavobacterium sp. N1994]|uniref:T9SS type B sorting domain-containing protein n=1 Tax=Flavobacterium sp. N1994 TaxID=2986827 RepID=UPI002222818A|nr:T9SS type B sorting domain-containing protein [Flavobacterium sp. N1994]
MKKRLLFLLFVLLCSLNCQSQFSKTHYIPPLSNSDLQEPHYQTLYISCPSITPISFQLQEIGGATITGTVSRDNPYIYDIGTGFDTQVLISRSDVGTIKNNKGYIIQAQDLVYVTVRMTSSQGDFQAGGIVSKGNAALGTQFRIGAFVNTFAPSTSANHYTFATILATENNTEISFGDIKPGVQLINNTAAGNTPANIFLNAGESYAIAVEGTNTANKDGLIGASITSTKPIAVNCGSFAGTNGTTNNLDLGFDQIVSAERTGKEYIFIKGSGVNEVERPLIVANENGTDVFLNGSTTPYITLNSGQYLSLDGTSFSANGNLYINTSKNVFAYQGIGGSTSQANQNMQFLPPLSCQTPKSINNIPYISQVGTLGGFNGTVCIVTKVGATLNFIIDGTNYTLANLPATSVNGPSTITGNTNYVTYTFEGLIGNISVFSSEEVYLSYYGSSGAATYGGFYSGFTFKPEVALNGIATTQTFCIPNSVLSVNAISNFDSFQWFFNNNPISGATTNTYTPTTPGYYKVVGQLIGCPLSVPPSDNIPVSSCPTDADNDGIIDSLDLDNDDDGITNCMESFGNKDFDFTNLTTGTIAVANYSNSYTGAVSFLGTGTPQTIAVTGDSQGNFTSETAIPKNNSVLYTLSNFTKPLNISIEYPTSALTNDLLTAASEIRITCPVNKTLTILNTNNQLLIDTNYDGIFESGVTQFSSFELRLRLNGVTPLVAGSGTFSIRGTAINSLIIQNLNISDVSSSRVKLHVTATCVPKDSDNDGIPDQDDYDSDNDGILDIYEIRGQSGTILSNVDVNQDGIDDVFNSGVNPIDTDNDGIPNYLDLDSDNDGIHDLDESGFNTIDANNNGVIDGSNFGTNGLLNSLETSPDSGILNPIYSLADTDGDGIYNAIELDSDNDSCNDVIEAGYLDSNLDGLLGGTAPPTVNTTGLVTSGTGYGNPNPNYITAAPIVITTQPQNTTACELQSATFSISTNAVNSYQWQLSTNGGISWSLISNNATYSGAATNSLTVSNVTPAMVGYQYRVFLMKNGNTCGLLSNAATLTTFALPVITTPITLKQCDDDTDGISIFNLTQKNDVISTNYLAETFTYYTTQAAANTQNNAFLISNPIAFTSSSASVYARVENSNGCYRVARIDLIVSVTQIPASFVIPNQYKCDDFIDAAHDDRDGVSSFNFSSITASLVAILPTNVAIKYYKTQADFLAETDASGNSLAIQNPTNYRNIGFPNHQTIWVRVESTLDNSCFGFKTFDVIVEALPVANPVNALNLIRHCDDDQNGIYGFNTSTIQATVLNGQTNANVKYFRANGTPLSTPLPNPFFVNGTETITIRVQNNTTLTGGQPCYDEETLQFIVDDLPEAFALNPNLTSFCDDEPNPVDQNGLLDFNTSTFEATILGSQTGMQISYTLQNGTVLNHLPNPFRTGTQNVLVTVTNPINTTCTAQVIIPFVVHPTPKIDQQEHIIICLPDTQAILDAGILDNSPTSNYQFQWYSNGVLMTSVTTPTLTVSATGTYSVDVTNAFGCTKTRVITVTRSQIASIQSIDVVDLSDVDTITVNVTGAGVYEYAIDDISGPYQDSNLFYNVPMGIHEIYIRDKNECGTVGPITVAVLGIPHYFTPNGDGYNDYWNVKGVSADFNYHSTIYIFDRFGKLLKQIGTTGLGWDGTFNGHPMPADDYWYNIQFEDGRSAKGHFTLKR